MCGIVGVIAQRGDLLPQDKKMFTQLLLVDVLRGAHSTSVHSVTRSGVSNYYKKAMNSSDFLDLKTTTSIVNKPCAALIGHNRYATQGAINDENAHPFRHGSITLVHNGSLVSTTDLPDHKNFTVDSENITHSINVEGALPTIEKLHGAFVLVWHDSTDNKIHFVRNSERPLHMGRCRAGDIYFASEEGSLKWITDRNNVKLVENIELPVGRMLSISLNGGKEEWTDAPLRKIPPYNSSVYGSTNTANTYTTKKKNKSKEFISRLFTPYGNSKDRGKVSGVTTGDNKAITVHNFALTDYEVGCLYIADNPRSDGTIMLFANDYTVVYEEEAVTEEKKPREKLRDCRWCGHPVDKSEELMDGSGGSYHDTCYSEVTGYGMNI